MDDTTNARLPTFKAPRDLTLSKGSLPLSRPRKTYVPNIPPRRERSDSVSSTSSTDSVKSGASTSSTSARPKVNNRKKERPELVQSNSIFSEGVGDGTKSKKFTRHSSATSSTSASSGGNRGKSDGKSTSERGGGEGSRGEGEDRKSLVDIDSLLGDMNFIADLEEDRMVDSSLEPISLPLSKYLDKTLLRLSQQRASATKSRKDALLEKPKIKSEFPEEAQIEGEKEAEREEATFKPQISPPLLSFSSSFEHCPPEGSVFFIQLPDHLPVLEKTEEDEKDKEGKLSTDINSLPEGYIGKIQIMASGKSKFVLGENSFEIEPGKPVAFRQELVSIDLEEKKMTNMGSVSQKFIFVPELEALLSKAL